VIKKLYVEKIKCAHITCREELAIRQHFVEQLLKNFYGVHQTLYDLSFGKAELVFDGEVEQKCHLKQNRLNEQREEVYKEVDDLDTIYFSMSKRVEEIFEELHTHYEFLHEMEGKIKEASALKEFVASGIKC
jgi:uncharacterized coiled-coil DUF342 family protein